MNLLCMHYYLDLFKANQPSHSDENSLSVSYRSYMFRNHVLTNFKMNMSKPYMNYKMHRATYMNNSLDCHVVKSVTSTFYSRKREHDIEKVPGLIRRLVLFQMLLNNSVKKPIHLRTCLLELRCKTLEIEWL